MIYTISFIGGAIFDGTFLIVLFLLLAGLFRIILIETDQKILIEAVNSILLFGSILYALTLLAPIFICFFSAGEYEQFVFSNRLFGSYWWATLALLTKSILLPQILWIRKFRKSFLSTSIIVSFWLLIEVLAQLSYGLSDIFRQFKWGSYLIGLSIYTLILIGAYYILKRKNTSSLSYSNSENTKS